MSRIPAKGCAICVANYLMLKGVRKPTAPPTKPHKDKKKYDRKKGWDE